jgi:hypothetical protein
LGLFSDTAKLQNIDFNNNAITALPAGLFDGCSALFLL